MSAGGSQFAALCDEFRRDFYRRATQGRDEIDEFIARGTLTEIWLDKGDRFCSLIMPDIDWRTSLQDHIQTMSILIDINWSGWSRFEDIFLRTPNRTDSDLPEYSKQDFMSSDFLGPDWGGSFAKARFFFCPIDIKQGKRVNRSKGWRLPYIYDNETGASRPNIGAGSAGEVIRVEIAPGHFWSPSGNYTELMPNSKSLSVAVKKFSKRGAFEKEVKILEGFSQIPTRHIHVVQMLAAVAVGDELGVVLPLAQANLEDLLMARHKLEPNSFDVPHLLEQVANLAAALDHIHQADCCHQDFKPENVLVYDSLDGFAQSPVGLWAISDFGMAKFVLDGNTGRTNSEGIKPRRPRNDPHSTYEAPNYGTDRDPTIAKSDDVWGLGCILVRVLAFGLDGVTGLQELDRQRAYTDTGVSESRDDCFYRGSPPSLNPHIKKWIDELPNRCSVNKAFWIGCRELLLQALAMSASDRLTARQVSQELNRLRSEYQPVGYIGTRHNSTASSHSSGGVPSPRDYEDLRSFIQNHRFDYLDLLRTKYPDILQQCDDQNTTPLNYAIKVGKGKNISTVMELLQRLQCPADVNIPSKNGMTPLMTAASHGYGILVTRLLEHGAGCGYTCEGRTCLHFATQANDADVIREICKSEPQIVNVSDASGTTPLLMFVKHSDAAYRDPKMTKEMFKAFFVVDSNAKACLSQPDKGGETPLYVAIENGNELLTKLLLDEGAEIGDLDVPTKLGKMKEEVRNLFYKSHARTREISGPRWLRVLNLQWGRRR
ncbi:uncharacterized protein BP01DRAFT_393062 [Aspergillus saccharolyticus JOP 1030-1]|uniref:Protein kinase domain-containing protein n=1 Tax=Aspergillus saccharolyticus JOP 1030-1 TaxID=1450539 RepID=A0A318ZV38_9EURO|nr:hypothetical protein BP01DRAFT_393062 [Aspergillus saccharolyticus JOP 1030-1]PYH43988.1 hypothetical protein BP01DRAFT_393062 [Aspergillus saccharolyticus JOP 1030-1]